MKVNMIGFSQKVGYAHKAGKASTTKSQSQKSKYLYGAKAKPCSKSAWRDFNESRL